MGNDIYDISNEIEFKYFEKLIIKINKINKNLLIFFCNFFVF